MVYQAMNAMEWVARIVFCAPPPSENNNNPDFQSLSRPKQILHILALVFDIVDLLDGILDMVEGIRLWQSGNGKYGFFLLCGILIARLVASKGKRVLREGGLQWAPFFQDRR